MIATNTNIYLAGKANQTCNCQISFELFVLIFYHSWILELLAHSLYSLITVRRILLVPNRSVDVLGTAIRCSLFTTQTVQICTDTFLFKTPWSSGDLCSKLVNHLRLCQY